MSKYISFPLDETWYTAEAEQLYNSNRTNGVFSANDEFLTTFKSGMTITVSPGRAWLHIAKFKGFVFGSFENVDLTLDIGDGTLNRIDRILIRYNVANNTTSLVVLKGTPATNPTAPNIVREPLSYYDLCIAEVRIDAGTIVLNQGMISDKRLDETLCGVVKDGIESIPTQALQQQWESWFSNLSTKSEADIQNWYNTNTTLFGNQFNTWFATLKNTLDSNQAGNLFNLINSNKNKITAIETNTTNANYTTKTITLNSISLPDAVGGFAKLTLEGNTRYKKADGTYTDTWEQGVTLESVGEAEGNKIEVLSRGKNLFNLLKIFDRQSSTYEINNDKIKINSTATTTASIVKFNIKVKPNTQFVFKANSSRTGTTGGGIYIVDAISGAVLVPSLNANTLNPEISFTTINDSINIFLYAEFGTKTGSSATFWNIQLEEGDTSTPYEPYKEDKINILLSNPLRSIKSNLKDTIDFNGILTRKIGIRTYQLGDENNNNYTTDKINTLYPLDTSVIENLNNSMNLQVFKDGSVTINTVISPTTIINYPKNLKAQIDSNSNRCNELFQYADNIKKSWVDVIGSPLTTTDTSDVLKKKTQDIKDKMIEDLKSKGVTVTGTGLGDISTGINSVSNKISVTKIWEKDFTFNDYYNPSTSSRVFVKDYIYLLSFENTNLDATISKYDLNCNLIETKTIPNGVAKSIPIKQYCRDLKYYNGYFYFFNQYSTYQNPVVFRLDEKTLEYKLLYLYCDASQPGFFGADINKNGVILAIGTDRKAYSYTYDGVLIKSQNIPDVYNNSTYMFRNLHAHGELFYTSYSYHSTIICIDENCNLINARPNTFEFSSDEVVLGDYIYYKSTSNANLVQKQFKNITSEYYYDEIHTRIIDKRFNGIFLNFLKDTVYSISNDKILKVNEDGSYSSCFNGKFINSLDYFIGEDSNKNLYFYDKYKKIVKIKL